MAKEIKDGKDTNKNTTTEGKLKALDLAVQQIEKQFGAGSIMKMGEGVKNDIEAISTGAISLDIALGIGGVPKGRIIEIYGPESSGKTTLALHILAEAQQKGGTAAFIDAENALDPGYAKKIGVDLDNMYISQPDYGEQALEILETLVRSAAVDVVVVDSVAALTPRAEIEGDMGDSHMGLQARLMSQALRKVTAIANKTGTTVIFLNQLRMKIGVMFGNPETTTGGNALKFYASIRMEIRKKDKIEKEGILVGATTRVKVVKNKVAPPFKEAMFDIMFPVEGVNKAGIDKYSSLIDAAVQFGVIEKAGSWFRRGGTQLAQGKESLRDVLREDSKLTKEILSEVKKAANI